MIRLVAATLLLSFVVAQEVNNEPNNLPTVERSDAFFHGGQRCGPNEEQTRCSSPTCEASCGKAFIGDCRVCVPGYCSCRPGFFRLGRSCVPASQCGQRPPMNQCSFNERPARCSSPTCEATCRNPFASECRVCVPGYCECIPGTVRIGRDCVPASHCQGNPPPFGQCGRDEERARCSSPSCEATCAKPFIGDCKVCQPGYCQCRSGFLRQNGLCVRANQCPTQEPPFGQCGPNEVQSKCSSAFCESTCNKPFIGDCKFCTPGYCSCRPGFFRSSNGLCVPRRQCDSNPPRDDACRNWTCPRGYRCTEDYRTGSPVCIRDRFPGGPGGERDGCDFVNCARGYHCEIEQCFGRRCDTTPKCIRDRIG